MSSTVRRGYCALCISRCGCVGHIEDGRLIRVEPDPEHPTGQALCVKARAAPEAVYAPERILHPLLRTRPKDSPDPGWQRISWDEALDRLAAKIRDAIAHHGPRALAFGVATPSGTAVADAFVWIHRLAHALESPNLVFATENCNWHKDFAPAYTWGAGIGMPDYARTGCILLWGFNPSTAWLAQATRIRQARRRGARLIVVDPRRAGLATSADLWLRPTPGTDAALALGLAHLLIDSDRIDQDFVRSWSDAPFLVSEADGRILTAADLTAGAASSRPLAWDDTAGEVIVCAERPPNPGPPARLALSGRYRIQTLTGPVDCRPVFARLAERCQAWPPPRVEAATGIPAAQVAATADLLASSGPVSFFTWTGTCQHGNATQTGRCIAALYALTGHLDAPGGNVWFGRPTLADMSGFDRVSADTRGLTLGMDTRPHGPPQKGWITTRDLFAAIAEERPYPVRALLAFGGNFLLSKPYTRLQEEALRKLDFLALAELLETPTARYADLLLPVCTAWEREGLQAGFQVDADAEAHIQLRPAFVPPRGESRSDTWIVFELAKRLGLADQFHGAEPEAALAASLAPAGLTPDELRAVPGGIRLPLEQPMRKYRDQGFATPSGRIEFHSARLASVGLDPLPDALPPGPPPEPGYPLILTTAKWPQYCHSQMRHLPFLRQRMPEPLVELHPRTAQERGIGEGDWIQVVTHLGAMSARARLDVHLDPRVVCAQYGWWQYPDGAGDANRIIDGECFDPVAGSNCLRHIPCQVHPLAGAIPQASA
ncbi:MAG TPA: molybdopterin-dependent oxidoreductase [Thiobacillaceae bacterium]|nr:molybdopterin-dependent oxidoreductase [Thiobacillaceae bacterium]HNU65203.1 molybdopterin-dependent oxidoreductase [Thiobacillaceae bacterium]